MKYKKNYINLIDSIVISIVLLLTTPIVVLMFYAAFESTNIFLTLSIILFFPTIFLIVLIGLICNGYSYWYFDDEIIYTKNLFGKKKIIRFDEIEKVEVKEKARYFNMTDMKTGAYIIYSKTKKITVFLAIKTRPVELEAIMNKYISDNN
jgi:membrane protein YdbS with pleckstrin-like domain